MRQAATARQGRIEALLAGMEAQSSIVGMQDTGCQAWNLSRKEQKLPGQGVIGRGGVATCSLLNRSLLNRNLLSRNLRIFVFPRRVL
jgi:hypothetical protein